MGTFDPERYSVMELPQSTVSRSRSIKTSNLTPVESSQNRSHGMDIRSPFYLTHVAPDHSTIGFVDHRKMGALDGEGSRLSRSDVWFHRIGAWGRYVHPPMMTREVATVKP